MSFFDAQYPGEGRGSTLHKAPKPKDTNWRLSAACRDLPPQMADAIFFDSYGTKQAAMFCGRCPVKQECRAFAESWNQTWGIWAGRQYPGHQERSSR